MAPTLYLGMDGTGVPMRATAVQGRAGKQPDGTANTREVKLVTVWSAEAAPPTARRCAMRVHHLLAAIESAAQKDTDDGPSPFAARVEREATRRGFDRAARRAVLGDGATWIWNLADEYFPDAVQIVDRFHTKQHLSDVGKAITARPATWPAPGPTPAMTNWMQANSTPCSPPCAHTRTTTRRGDVPTTSSATATACSTRRVAPPASAPRPGSSKPAARSPSAPTSSDRDALDRGRADAIIALRCCLLSGRYEDSGSGAQPPGPLT